MSCLMQLNCSPLKMHLFAFWPTPSLPKLISLPTVVTQLDIMWMFLYISPVFIFDQLTWRRKLRQDVLILFTQASTTEGTTLNWILSKEIMQESRGKVPFICAIFSPLYLSWFLPPPADGTTKSEGLGHAASGLPVKERWFCEKPGHILDNKDKAGSSISRDQHEQQGCLVFVVKCRELFLASITVVLE